MFPKVFIIVLHYQNWGDTNECLKSLEKLDYPNFEKIVIDNDKYNRGFAGGNNLGIKKAMEKNADYILLLNNDTVVEPDFLRKRKVIEEIGLMDEDYFLYCEDVDWCLKARKRGFSCLVVLDSKISHKVSKNAKIESFSYIYYHTRNGLLLARKNASIFIQLLAYKISFLIYLKQVIKLLFFPQKRIWAKAIMRGIEDFYRGRFGKYENRN